jgi:glycerol-3-phosphate dehydrogenase
VPGQADYDVVVVGAGVLGAAIAARLSATSASVCVLEEADDVAEGASKGNAGITSSYYAPPGTLEAELIAASHPRWEDICGRLDVPFDRRGALTVAVDAEQEAMLPQLLADARGAGTRAELLTAAEAREREPLLGEDCRGAVMFPDEGIIDPMRLTWALAELAAANGADLLFASPALGFATEGDRVVEVTAPAGAIRTRWVVNAAGLGAGRVSALAGGERIEIWPRKGQYWILDRAFGERMSMIVLPVPMPHTRGVQVVPTTNGSALLGPDARDIVDEDDRATDGEGLEAILHQTARLVPEATAAHAIKTYAANRAACDETVRLRRDAQVANLVQVGNRSTGVSCAPETAERVLGLLRELGLDAPERPAAVDRLPPTRRLLFDPEPESLIAADPRYGQVVCVCEQVTAAEIARAFEGGVPARSIEGVRKRTRATAGRCQGSVCMAGVAFMCSLATGSPPEAVRHGPAPGTLGIGSAR